MKKVIKKRAFTEKKKEFTDLQVISIRKQHANGISISALSKKYNSRWLYIKDAIEGVTHKHVKEGKMKANVRRGLKNEGDKVGKINYIAKNYDEAKSLNEEFKVGDLTATEILNVIKMRVEKGMSKHEIAVKTGVNYDTVLLIVDSFTKEVDGKYAYVG